MKGIKHSSPLKIDMDIDEALARFIQTEPSEVEALIKRGKKAKPPGSKKKRKPSGGGLMTMRTYMAIGVALWGMIACAVLEFVR